MINTNTKIFLDSADPQETIRAKTILGDLAGQTTNPTKLSQHPIVKAQILKGKKFTDKEIFSFYKMIINEIDSIIPSKAISIEVNANSKTTIKEMLVQAEKMIGWAKNAFIKFPTTLNGLKAARFAVKNQWPVNMTLCFNQEQAAAVYAATKGAKYGQVLISPFIGRLEDNNKNGIDLVKNILKMYQQSQKYVLVLASSIRTLDHLLASIKVGADITTSPIKVIEDFANIKKEDFENFNYKSNKLKKITYKHIAMNKNYEKYKIKDKLTEAGLKIFADDWQSLVN